MSEPVIDRRQNIWLAAVSGVVVALLAIVVALVSRPPLPVAVIPAPMPEAIAVSADGVEHFGGWHRDEAAIAANLDPAVTLHFDRTPAGQVVRGDEDVFLWRAVRQAAARAPPWYPNINQADVGYCVGCGNKHAVDVVQAVQIVAGKPAEFKPVSAEAIYAFSRVEVGGGKIRGDGSVGVWAAQALQRYGVLAMEKQGSFDLSTNSPSLAREWGRTGVPEELEPIAAKHVVKSAALVKTWSDVKRSLQQCYPVTVCSNVGFAGMVRDRDGFCRASGTWNHCMVLIGVRSGAREGAFCLNSWGDTVHTGPVWPADAPVAGFWIDSATVEKMVRQGDSFALSDVVGFPSRTLPEFLIQAKPVDRRLLARLDGLATDRSAKPDLSGRSINAIEHPLAW